MTRITIDQPVVTLINVFTVEPELQQPLADLLIKATQETMCKMPGYVSANIHKSLDGRYVTNYAQWRSKEDFEAMLQNAEAVEHMQAVLKIAHMEPHLYEVAFIDEVAIG
jgi:hypothetical protein